MANHVFPEHLETLAVQLGIAEAEFQRIKADQTLSLEQIWKVSDLKTNASLNFKQYTVDLALYLAQQIRHLFCPVNSPATTARSFLWMCPSLPVSTGSLFVEQHFGSLFLGENGILLWVQNLFSRRVNKFKSSVSQIVFDAAGFAGME